MVNISFGCRDGKLFMAVEGHAGAVESGIDPVCAGVTTLAYTLAQCAMRMEAEGMLAEKPTISLRPGEALVSIKSADAGLEKAETAMQVVHDGCACLADNYPEYVRIFDIGNGIADYITEEPRP